MLKEIGETNQKFEIPGYQVLERLGKGSMGVVLKARQTSVDRIVAVKILLDALAQNKEFIKRFDRAKRRSPPNSPTTTLSTPSTPARSTAITSS